MAETNAIELSIVEPLGIDRLADPITMGVPFPEGVLTDCNHLCLQQNAGPIPLQARPMLTWPDGSVKWALLDFQADLSAGKDNRLDLIYGKTPDDTPRHMSPVSMDKDGEHLHVSTGPLKFSVSLTGPLPLEHIEVFGKPVLGQGDLQSSVTIDGTVCQLRAMGLPVIEEPGPLRAVIRVDGQAVFPDGRRGFDVAVRIYAYAGKPTLRVYMTLINRIPEKLVHLNAWKMHLSPRLEETGRDGFIVSSINTGVHTSHVDPLIDGSRTFRVDLVDMPYPPWEPATPDMEDETPEQPRKANPNYTIIPGDKGEANGEQRTGGNWCNLVPAAAVLGDMDLTVTLMCRRPWHQAPKEVTLTGTSMDLSLYPDWAEPLEWYRGVAKTHEIFLDFTSGPPNRDDRMVFAGGVEKRPSPQVATRNWMVDSGVFGPVFRYQPEKYRWWEYIMRAALQKHTFNIESDPLLGLHIFNYGDYWRLGRGGQWYNNEMDKGYALMLQMIRTGYGVVMEHIEPIIHHQIDIDTCHDAEETWWIGSQRYHFAKHGVMHRPALCHEWIDGPLFFYLLTGYKRAEEVALARAEHFRQAIEQGEHRVKTLTRVAGYPIMAMSRMYENYHDEQYMATCETIMDWLEEWVEEDGGYFYNAYTPPGETRVATGLSDGILSCALMRHHMVTGSQRSWQLLKNLIDNDIQETGVIHTDGFILKSSSPFRDYYEPEPDFWFEPMVYMTKQSGDARYADIGYANMQRIFVQRRMLLGDAENLPPHFYRYWLPFLAQADALGILKDPVPF